MPSQIENAVLFNSLHQKGEPLVLFNVWDAGSAQAVQASGAKAIATGSWAVAAAYGYSDGEKIPLESVIANLKRIIASVDLPVTLDFECGYGKTLAELKTNIVEVIHAGAVGINFEDQIIGGKDLYSIEEQCSRIKAIHSAAEQLSVPLFINARSDVFFKVESSKHNESHLEEAVKRASAYAEAGANGFFAPGLSGMPFIKKLCERSPVPVNIMMTADMSSQQLAELGVARISYGPGPYRQVMNVLKEMAEKAFAN